MTDQGDKDKGADAGDVLDALKRQPSKMRGGHSPLYLWLWRHHEQLKGELNLPRRTDWSALAGELGRRGIMDGNGKPPTTDRTRKAWWQVNRDKEALAAGTIRRRRKPGQPGGPLGEVSRQGQAASSTPVHATPAGNNGMLPSGIEPPGEEESEFKFEFMSAKDWTKVTDKGDE